MTYTPSYANDEHRRIAAAALRLSHLNTANDVRDDAATSSPDRQLGGREAEPDSPIVLPQAAFILSSAAESGSVDAEGDVDVDTDRDAEDWRRMKVKMGSSRGSKDSSLRRHDVTSHTCHSHHSYQSHQSRHSQANCHDRHRVDPDHDMEEDEGEDDPIDEPGCSHENAFFILLRISFYLPPFTIFAALYAFLSLIFLLLAIPLRLCPPSQFFKPPTSLTEQTCRLLVPLLRLNRRIVTSTKHSRRSHPKRTARRHHSTHSTTSTITSPRQSYTNSTPVSASFSSYTIPTQPVTVTSRPYSNYSAPMLVAVHLLSPLLLPPTLLAAWICACFWIFVMIMGNPDGKEKTDDGRAAVLAVRNWWCLWLASARRKRKRSGTEAV
ncbi:conserved hypothetical protein [Microsporum canis CBS 113480]|uniref:Uncharacterized protein n=1 Tax=Arthroderma otae (strain ATCC MYA-4605 / CBS 113480) TaxID=554155 RepID=C5FN62_ARTOC|nr:conserved hypothetical protein [Microsporum canis CBS 113480]EEQ31298.1 conserved hypothetical protein [Microsporum canis CBS 113480]